MPSRSLSRCACACRQRGVAAVEFAFLVLILLLIAAGLVEFGRALWYYDALAKGTRDAARYLSVVPAGQLPTLLQAARGRVLDAAAAARVPAVLASQIEVNCVPTPCSAVTRADEVSRIQVAVRYPLTLGDFFPLIRLPDDTATRALTLGPQTTMPYLWSEGRP